MKTHSLIDKARRAAAAGQGYPMWFMRQAGRYLPEYLEIRRKFKNFLEFTFNIDAASRVTLQPIERFPELSAAIIFSDILVIPHALGQEVSFEEGVGPKLLPCLNNSSQIQQLCSSNLDSFLEKLRPVSDLVRSVRRELHEEKNLFGFSGTPWTLASYMIGATQHNNVNAARVFAYQYPKAFQNLIDLLTTCVTLHLKEQIRAGVDSVQLFESLSQALPDNVWSQYCLQPVHNIVKDIKNEFPHVAVSIFSKSVSPIVKRYVDETQIDIMSIETAMSLEYARDVLQPKVIVQGNLDPELLACGGDMLTNRVQEILENLGSAPFIFNLGHGILPYTPVDNVARVLKQVASYNKKY